MPLPVNATAASLTYFDCEARARPNKEVLPKGKEKSCHLEARINLEEIGALGSSMLKALGTLNKLVFLLPPPPF